MKARLKEEEKKKLPCLRCGKMMLTRVGRRFCRKCRRHNAGVYDARSYSYGTML